MDELVNPLEQLNVTELKYSPEIIKAINNDLPGFVNGSVAELKECEKKKQAAIRSAGNAKNAAEQAVKKSRSAKDMSTGLFKNGKAIEALKVVTESEATALDDISKAQCDQAEAIKVMFENQKKQAVISRNLCLLGMGNQAVANTVLKKLKEGIEQGEMTNISEDVYQEFERIVMWWSQVEDMNAKIRSYEQMVSDIMNNYESLENRLSDIKTDLQKEIEEQNNTLDSIQTNFSTKSEVNIGLDKIKEQIGQNKTSFNESLHEHRNELNFLSEDLTHYKNQFFNKKLFKISISFVTIIALILSIVALLG